jgi:hypothetical protein
MPVVQPYTVRVSANGVILVTTKKGKKNAAAALTYNGQAGVQVPHVGYKPVHSLRERHLRNEAVVNAGLSLFTARSRSAFQQSGDNNGF